MPYAEVAVKAILPAILYFSGIFIAVHLEAKKLGLQGIPRTELPKWGYLLRNLYLILPLVLLVWLVSSGAKTMATSAALSILASFIIGFIHLLATNLRQMNGQGFGKILWLTVKASLLSAVDALAAGAKGAITVAVACAMAGMIAGCITVTGPGLHPHQRHRAAGRQCNHRRPGADHAVLHRAGHGRTYHRQLLHHGLHLRPHPDASMGFSPVAAHFFVFYFGIVADITPPVALAAYAGSAIAKSNPMKTGIQRYKAGHRGLHRAVYIRL